MKYQPKHTQSTNLTCRMSGLTLTCLLTLTACGGGGGGSAPPAAPANTAPTFAGVFDVQVAEGAAVGVSVTVSDADGDAITLTIGGADASLLTIDSQSQRVTANTFDFENPADANTDNIYEFTVTASDGQASTVQPFTLTVTNISDNPPVFSGTSDAAVDEGQTVSVDVAVVDADDDALTLTLAGDDAALFTLNAQARTVTADPFDFERPTDTGADNVYTFQVIADDGVDVVEQPFTLSIADVAEPALEQLGLVQLIGTTPFDSFGDSIISLGDANADGFDELVIGASSFVPDEFSDEIGRVSIVSGAGLNALQEGRSLVSELGGDLVTLDGINGDIFDLGRALNVLPGLDGDTAAELVVSGGFPRNAYVIAGTAITASFNSDGVIDVREIGDGGAEGGALVTTSDSQDVLFGESSAIVDDIDGDGLGELFICVNNANVNGELRVGRGYLLFSSSLAVTIAANGREDLATADASRVVVIEGEADDQGFCGSAASAGDVDGDGLGDVIVGVSPGFDQPGLDREAFLVFGATLNAERQADGLINTAQIETNGQGIRFVLEAPDGRANVDIGSIPDLNGDGFDELLLGDRFADGSQGAAYLVFGSDQLGAQTNGVVSLSDVGDAVPGIKLSVDDTAVRVANNVVAVGDVDGDGLGDMLINGRLANAARQIRLFLVSGSALTTSNSIELTRIGVDPALADAQTPRGVEIVGVEEDLATADVTIAAAGDIDGDGLADIAIGTESTDLSEVTVISGRLLRDTMGPGERRQQLDIGEVLDTL